MNKFAKDVVQAQVVVHNFILNQEHTPNTCSIYIKCIQIAFYKNNNNNKPNAAPQMRYGEGGVDATLPLQVERLFSIIEAKEIMSE